MKGRKTDRSLLRNKRKVQESLTCQFVKQKVQHAEDKSRGDFFFNTKLHLCAYTRLPSYSFFFTSSDFQGMVWISFGEFKAKTKWWNAVLDGGLTLNVRDLAWNNTVVIRRRKLRLSFMFKTNHSQLAEEISNVLNLPHPARLFFVVKNADIKFWIHNSYTFNLTWLLYI